MGWLSKLAGRTDHLHLEVLMDLNLRTLQGRAALQWELRASHPSLSEDQCRIALAGLLYSRILVIHTETREELFRRVGKAALGLINGDSFLIVDPWLLQAGGLAFQIWPWTVVDPKDLPDAKGYVATLQSTARGTLDIHLKMALGQERVLAPATVLIVAFELSRALDTAGRLRLGRVLAAINGHYESPDAVRIMSERHAMLAAMPALMS